MMNPQHPSIDPMWSSGNYLFMDKVDEDSCKTAIRFIQYHNSMGRAALDEIQITLNTPGGCVRSCFALVDTMLTSKVPVNTAASGLIASCGVLLMMTGKKRVISQNCKVMSHQYSWGTAGKHSDLMAHRKAQDMAQDMIMNHYRKCTKKTQKYIEKHLLPHEDVWMTPEEAVTHGIADEVKDIYK